MFIYIIRHAKSLPRDGMQYADASKVSLSAEGIVQSENLKDRIRKEGIEHIVSSPFPRTKQTAEIISDGKISISFDERLIEQAPSKTLVGTDFKKAKKQTREDKDFIPENGESFNSAAKRFIDALSDISNLSYKKIAIVSHALVIEAALTNLFDLKEIPKIEEASVTLLESDGKKFNIVYINKTRFSLKKAIKKLLNLR